MARANPFVGRSYGPFHSYKLPLLTFDDSDDDGTATIRWRSEHMRDQTFPLYRLSWPGESHIGDHKLSTRYMKGWPTWPEASRTSRKLSELYEKNLIPRNPGHIVGYHLAIHRESFRAAGSTEESPRARYGVGALEPEMVDYLMDTRFAMDKGARATANYLKWMAESHRRHPLFRFYDTVIRDELHEICETFTFAYFRFISDYIYDFETERWARGEKKYAFKHLASYLHWLSRTGSGLVLRFARLQPLPWRLRDDCGDGTSWIEQVAQAHDTGMRLKADKIEPVVGPIAKPANNNEAKEGAEELIEERDEGGFLPLNSH